MKKLFFTALVAVAAIGGATAEVYLQGQSTPLPCIPGETTCAIVYGSIGYEVPFSTNPADPKQDASTQVDLNDYSLEQ